MGLFDKLLGVEIPPEYGYGRCRRCGWSWMHRDYHVTPAALPDGGAGMFVLCELCWERLTPEARLPYYQEVWKEHYGHPHYSWTHERMVSEADALDRDWPLIEAAVLAGL